MINFDVHGTMTRVLYLYADCRFIAKGRYENPHDVKHGENTWGWAAHFPDGSYLFLGETHQDAVIYLEVKERHLFVVEFNPDLSFKVYQPTDFLPRFVYTVDDWEQNQD